MTDHSARPDRPASSRTTTDTLAELHRLCDEDYQGDASPRVQGHRDGILTAPPSAEPSTPYDALHTPGKTPSGPFDLDVEIAVTRQILDETADLNIHDAFDMRKAAFALNARVRTLLAAIEAERDENR
ncbi:hypothetical protein [Streptomyces nodosus]|uniref:hypothetical protein n=1 Tax=Streptomyces nodosus TaxID=40318 RepID=UPI00380F36F7